MRLLPIKGRYLLAGLSAAVCATAILAGSAAYPPQAEEQDDVMAAHWTINRAALIAPQLLSAGMISQEEHDGVIEACLTAKGALDNTAEDLLVGDLTDAARQIAAASTQVRVLSAFLDQNEIKMPRPSPIALRRVGRYLRDT